MNNEDDSNQHRRREGDGARNPGGANRFERGNERRYRDAAYGSNEVSLRGDYERGGYEPSVYNRDIYGSSPSRGYDPGRDYSRGFGPNHGFGYSSREQRSGFGGGANHGPTGLDRDRLRARGEQGYGREPGGFSGRGPKDYKRSDERMREDVCDRLSQDDDVDASEISVRVLEGEVVLEGSVETRRQKHRAEEIAADVLGVSDVHNRMRVTKSLLSELKDKVIGDEQPSGGHAGSGTQATPSPGGVGRQH